MSKCDKKRDHSFFGIQNIPFIHVMKLYLCQHTLKRSSYTWKVLLLLKRRKRKIIMSCDGKQKHAMNLSCQFSIYWPGGVVVVTCMYSLILVACHVLAFCDRYFLSMVLKYCWILIIFNLPCHWGSSFATCWPLSEVAPGH